MQCRELTKIFRLRLYIGRKILIDGRVVRGTSAVNNNFRFGKAQLHRDHFVPKSGGPTGFVYTRQSVKWRFFVEAALGGLLNLKGTIMTTIAKLTKQKDGSFVGTLSTITLAARKISLAPVQSESEKAPIYTVMLEDMEIGAAWNREAKSGNEYTLVKLDCPLFAQPVFCVLVKDLHSGYALEWNRPDTRRFKKSQPANQAA
jgi:uncharacterized protein (DUF736 family)